MLKFWLTQAFLFDKILVVILLLHKYKASEVRSTPANVSHHLFQILITLWFLTCESGLQFVKTGVFSVLFTNCFTKFTIFTFLMHSLKHLIFMFHFTHVCIAFALMSVIIIHQLPLVELTENCFETPITLSQIMTMRKSAFWLFWFLIPWPLTKWHIWVLYVLSAIQGVGCWHLTCSIYSQNSFFNFC